jgi:hypothetical protein
LNNKADWNIHEDYLKTEWYDKAVACMHVAAFKFSNVNRF